MTRAEAQAHLDDALAQLSAARKAAGYGVGDMSKTSQALRDLQAEVDKWQRVVRDLDLASSGVSTTLGAVPRFR